MYNCPFCNEKHSNDKSVQVHMVEKHAELSKKLCELFNSMEDFGFFISCLEYEIEKSEWDKK